MPPNHSDQINQPQFEEGDGLTAHVRPLAVVVHCYILAACSNVNENCVLTEYLPSNTYDRCGKLILHSSEVCNTLGVQ